MPAFRVLRDAVTLMGILATGPIRWEMGRWSAANGSPLPVADPWAGLHYLRRRNMAKRIKGGWERDDGRPKLTSWERRRIMAPFAPVTVVLR